MDDYYDLDCILAAEEKVPTRFLSEGKGLGYLDPGSVDNDLLKDSKLELPLWLARTLVRKNLAMINLPKSFRSDLNADATVVDLHRYPYYYNVGHSLCLMLKDANLLQELGQTFAARYRMILDKSLNMQSHGSAEFTQTLAHSEVQLFHVGYNSTQEFDKWKTTLENKIATAASISNSSKKRKRNGTSEV